jgi:hypothetical protein
MSFKEKIINLKAKERQVIERAYARTSTEYHGYIVLLEQNLKVASKALEIDSELTNLGVFTYNGKTYLGQQIPYMSVDGRVAMATDEALKKGVQLEISPPEFREISEKLLCDVTVKTARGTSTGTSKINLGGSGVDASNPFENAQTSAIGRALAFQGYGLIGTGIASAEEIELAARDRQTESEKPAQVAQKTQEQPSKPKKEKEEKKQQKQEQQKNAPEKKKQEAVTQEAVTLGTFGFALQSAKLIPKGDSNIWSIFVEKMDDKKQMSLYVNPKIDFDQMDISTGELLEITVSRKGAAFVADEIKRAS